MRPQLLYLLLALTRVAGAWDALLADDGTIDLGGNVVAVAEDPDDPVAVPGNLGVQPTVRSQPGPGSMWGAHMAYYGMIAIGMPLCRDLYLPCWPHGPWPKDKRIGPFYIKTSPSAPAY